MRSILPRLRYSLFLAISVGVAACGSDTLTGPEGLSLARTRWSERGPSSYTVTIARSCECPVETMGPVDVTVKNGAVIARKYTQTGQDVAQQWAFVFPAVEGLFQIVDDAFKANTRPFEAKFDASLGYPTRIVIGNPAADGPITSVSNLRAQ